MVGAWTPAIRGMRARLVTALDDLDRGGRFVSVYVEFEHVHAYSSDIEIPSDRQLEVELLDEAQQPLPKRSLPYGGPGSEPKAISLSNGSVLLTGSPVNFEPSTRLTSRLTGPATVRTVSTTFVRCEETGGGGRTGDDGGGRCSGRDAQSGRPSPTPG